MKSYFFNTTRKSKAIVASLFVLLSTTGFFVADCHAQALRADKIFLGHVITMDEKKPTAEAIATKDGKIIYVGSANVAKSLSTKETETIDYSDKYIYPGFLEAHCHPDMAGERMIGQANLVPGESMEDYYEIMKEYIKNNPGKNLYIGSGWYEMKGITPTADLLDKNVSKDIPILMFTEDAHSLLMNHKALEMFKFNKESVKKYGSDQVRADANGDPTGYISDTPLNSLLDSLQKPLEDVQAFLLKWQDYALKEGITSCCNAGIELSHRNCYEAYRELQKNNKFLLRTYAYCLVKDNTENPEKDMEEIARKAKESNCEYFKILGAKVFMDGVIEAHTGWLLEEYADQPGYFGLARYNDTRNLANLIKAASKHELNVHAHCIGDAAAKSFTDACELAQKETGNMDMRNTAAHLQLMKPEEIKRFGELNIVAAAGITWAGLDDSFTQQQESYLGKERSDMAYPAKTLADNGAVLVAHSDYPVSPTVSVPLTIYCAVNRCLPSEKPSRPETEALSRWDAIKTITTNVAYAWHEENRLGSLEIGKLADMAVFDADFLNDDMDKIVNSKCFATIVNGNIVYKME